MSNNTQNMQIFTIIGQLEDMIERSPRPKLGNGANKRVIDAEEMIDLLGDLKVTIPEDIRRANSVMIESQTMIDNADEHARDVVANAQEEADRLIAQAHAAADDIVEKAKQEYERLVQEDEIYQEAQRRAELLAKKAEANASLVFENAKCYADDVLKDLESFLAGLLRDRLERFVANVLRDAALAVVHYLVDQLGHDDRAVYRIRKHFALRDKSTSGNKCPS